MHFTAVHYSQEKDVFKSQTSTEGKGMRSNVCAALPELCVMCVPGASPCQSLMLSIAKDLLEEEEAEQEEERRRYMAENCPPPSLPRTMQELQVLPPQAEYR